MTTVPYPFPYPSAATYPPPLLSGGYYPSPFPYASSSYPSPPAPGFFPAPAHGPSTFVPLPPAPPQAYTYPYPPPASAYTAATGQPLSTAPPLYYSSPTPCYSTSPAAFTSPYPQVHAPLPQSTALPSVGAPGNSAMPATAHADLSYSKADLSKGNGAAGAPINDEKLVHKQPGPEILSMANNDSNYHFVTQQAQPWSSFGSLVSSTITSPTPFFGSTSSAGSNTTRTTSYRLSSAPSTSPNTATAYDTNKVFGEMPAQNSWHGTHGTTPNYSPGHEKPIQNSCVQSVSTSSGCHNLDGMPQSYGFHNLHRQSLFLADGTEHSYFTLPADYPSEHAPQPMSSLVVEHVGITARLSAPCLAPANCSKANNTAGYDSLPAHGVQLPIVLQDAPNVFTEMPIYDDNHGQSNAFVDVLDSLHDQQTYEEQQEPEHPIKCFSRAPEIEQTSAHVSYYAIEQNGETTSVNVAQLRAPRLNLLEIDEMRKEWDTESNSLKYMLQSVSHPPILSYSFLLRYYSVKGNSWLNTVRQSMRDHVEGLNPLSLSTPWDPGDGRLHVMFTTASNLSLIAEVNTPPYGSIVMAAIAVYEVDTEEVEVKVDSGKLILGPERSTDGVFSFTYEKSDSELLAVGFNNASDNAFSEKAADLVCPHAPVIHADRSIKLTNEKSTQATSTLCVLEAIVHCHEERPEHIYCKNGLEPVQLNFEQEDILISGALSNVANSTAWEFVAPPSHCINHAKLRLLWDPGASISLHSSKANLCNQVDTYGTSTDLAFTAQVMRNYINAKFSVPMMQNAIQCLRFVFAINTSSLCNLELMANTSSKVAAFIWHNSVTGTPFILRSSTTYTWDPGVLNILDKYVVAHQVQFVQLKAEYLFISLTTCIQYVSPNAINSVLHATCSIMHMAAHLIQDNDLCSCISLLKTCYVWDPGVNFSLHSWLDILTLWSETDTPLSCTHIPHFTAWPNPLAGSCASYVWDPGVKIFLYIWLNLFTIWPATEKPPEPAAFHRQVTNDPKQWSFWCNAMHYCQIFQRCTTMSSLFHCQGIPLWLINFQVP